MQFGILWNLSIVNGTWQLWADHLNHQKQNPVSTGVCWCRICSSPLASPLLFLHCFWWYSVIQLSGHRLVSVSSQRLGRLCVRTPCPTDSSPCPVSQTTLPRAAFVQIQTPQPLRSGSPSSAADAAPSPFAPSWYQYRGRNLPHHFPATPFLLRSAPVHERIPKSRTASSPARAPESVLCGRSAQKRGRARATAQPRRQTQPRCTADDQTTYRRRSAGPPVTSGRAFGQTDGGSVCSRYDSVRSIGLDSVSNAGCFLPQHPFSRSSRSSNGETSFG